MPRKSSNPRLTPTNLAALHVSALAEGKAKYKIADAALDELLKKIKVGRVLTLADGKKFRLADKFATRNAIPVGQNARRFELEEITQP